MPPEVKKELPTLCHTSWNIWPKPRETHSVGRKTTPPPERLHHHPPTTTMELNVSQELPPDAGYPVWKCLNRLRSGAGRTKVTLSQWGYSDGDVVCSCGTEPQTMQHLLICPQLEYPCTALDLAEFNCKGQQCARFWLNHI